MKIKICFCHFFLLLASGISCLAVAQTPIFSKAFIGVQTLEEPLLGKQLGREVEQQLSLLDTGSFVPSAQIMQLMELGELRGARMDKDYLLKAGEKLKVSLVSAGSWRPFVIETHRPWWYPVGSSQKVQASVYIVTLNVKEKKIVQQKVFKSEWKKFYWYQSTLPKWTYMDPIEKDQVHRFFIQDLGNQVAKALKDVSI